jgi:hypothetical protein
MSRDEIKLGVKVFSTVSFLAALFGLAYVAGHKPYGSTQRLVLAIPAFVLVCATIGVWAPRRRR